MVYNLIYHIAAVQQLEFSAKMLKFVLRLKIPIAVNQSGPASIQISTFFGYETEAPPGASARTFPKFLSSSLIKDKTSR